MRERDRDASAVLRSAIAALENAEAVPTPDARPRTTSAEVATAALGVGSTETVRLVLDAATERALLAGEVAALREAHRVYVAAGDDDRARSAAAGARLLQDVLRDVVDGPVGGQGA